MGSLAEVLKSGDDSIADIYEDILLGKLMESSPPAEFISGEGVYNVKALVNGKRALLALQRAQAEK